MAEAIKPQDHESSYIKARIIQDMGNLDEAQKIYQQIIDL